MADKGYCSEHIPKGTPWSRVRDCLGTCKVDKNANCEECGRCLSHLPLHAHVAEATTVLIQEPAPKLGWAMVNILVEPEEILYGIFGIIRVPWRKGVTLVHLPSGLAASCDIKTAAGARRIVETILFLEGLWAEEDDTGHGMMNSLGHKGVSLFFDSITKELPKKLQAGRTK